LTSHLSKNKVFRVVRLYLPFYHQKMLEWE